MSCHLKTFSVFSMCFFDEATNLDTLKKEWNIKMECILDPFKLDLKYPLFHCVNLPHIFVSIPLLRDIWVSAKRQSERLVWMVLGEKWLWTEQNWNYNRKMSKSQMWSKKTWLPSLSGWRNKQKKESEGKFNRTCWKKKEEEEREMFPFLKYLTKNRGK